jgi:hypothetical protein
MIVVYLCLVRASRTLDLEKFVKGNWNATVHVLTEDGELEDLSSILRFQMVRQNDSFIGLVKGYKKDFNVSVSIDPKNPQFFRIDGPSGLLAQTEMLYKKRNLPLARGQWGDKLDHFKLVVFSGIRFELTVFRAEEKKAEIFRFAKTVVPEIWDGLKGLSVPMGIGVMMLVYRLFKAHKFLSGQEKVENDKKDDETTVVKEKEE